LPVAHVGIERCATTIGGRHDCFGAVAAEPATASVRRRAPAVLGTRRIRHSVLRFTTHRTVGTHAERAASVIFLGFGLLWPKLNLGPRALRVAFWCAVYSALAILAAYVIAAIWGVGNETIKLMGELPHGLSHGSAFQEGLIKVVAYTSAPTGLLAFTLILWGLRTVGPQRDHAELDRVERSDRTG
jgi:hypothetical protein